MNAVTGKYRKYSEYQFSGISWAGETPSHWKIKRFKNVFQIRKRIAGELGHDILSITQKGIKVKDTESGDGQLSMDYSKYQLVNPGDFAMNHMDLLTGYVDVSKYSGVTSPDYRVFTIEDEASDKKYFLYLLQLCYAAKIFFPLGQGAAHIGRWRLPTEAFSEFRTACPTFEEQVQIADFLDREIVRIDTLIEEQQSLIRLLKEKRQAVISHAVTKGLNPDAPMKDSGVEWLGEVPEHWRITKLGQLAFMQEGPGLRTWQFKDDGTRVICVTNITENGIDFSKLEKFISTDEYKESYQHFTVDKGDILLSSSGNSWGKVATYEGNEKVILNTSTIRLNELQHKPLVLDYIQFFLQSEACREQLGVAMTGSCQPNFGPTHLKEVKTPIPPEDEQVEISRFIAVQKQQFDQPIEACEQAVEFMLERRTALISAAVTGKIDVRDWQPATEQKEPPTEATV